MRKTLELRYAGVGVASTCSRVERIIDLKVLFVSSRSMTNIDILGLIITTNDALGESNPLLHCLEA